MHALVFTLGAFALILVLARLKAPLALAILIGAIAVGALFGQGPGQIALAVARGLIQPRTLGLLAITVALLALSGTMQAGGQMEEIVSLAKAIFRRPAMTMVALPALIGLLPMPGGALFSAPMVESAAGGALKTHGHEMLARAGFWVRGKYSALARYNPLFAGDRM